MPTNLQALAFNLINLILDTVFAVDRDNQIVFVSGKGPEQFFVIESGSSVFTRRLRKLALIPRLSRRVWQSR